MFGRTLSHPCLFWQSALRVAALLLCMAAPLAPAQALQEYTILATGEDRSETKAEAIAVDYAKKRAVYLAIRKLGFANNASTIAARIPAKEWPQLVRGANILQSKRVGEKTYAQVSVSVADEALRKLLDVKDTPSANAPAIAKKARNVLVLPVLALPEKTIVWGKENTLRDPLSTELMRQSHGSVILPGGDLQDLRLIDAENMKTVSMAEMKPMFDRYGVDEIIIAIATPSAQDSAEPTKILLRRLAAIHPRDEAMDLPPEQASAAVTARIAQAAAAIASVATEIATSTAPTERARLDAAKKIAVKLDYAIPRDLARIQTAIRGAPGVLLLELPSIALNNVTGTIYVEGDIAAVRTHLTKQGIVVRGKDTDWIVSTR